MQPYPYNLVLLFGIIMSTLWMIFFVRDEIGKRK